MFRLVGIVAAMWWLGSLGAYIGGRVILPAMGLTAPGFWAWFWFVMWAAGFGTVVMILKEVASGD